jgi:heat shock protein HtpX
MSMARAWPLRILLFLATNLAVTLVFGLVVALVPQLFGMPPFLGLPPGSLVFFALLGFGGAFISLAMSKSMALWSTGAKVIRDPQDPTERWLFGTVGELADQAGLGRPDVAVYASDVPNAFATGMRRNHALVAVSTGLLRAMKPEEVKAVLAHEVAHVANGDMVTMALLQGVLNTFVYAASRIVGTFVDGLLSRGGERGGGGVGYFFAVMVSQVVFGLLASVVVAWFSRRREFRADAGAAELVGAPPMIAALQRLGSRSAADSDLPENLAAFGIQGGTLAGLFHSHPPLEARIAALRQR